MAGNIRRSSKNSWTVAFGDRGSENSLYEIFYNFKDAKKFYDDNQDWVGKTRGRPWTPKVKGLSEELLNTATKKLTNNKFKTYSALEGKEHSSLRQLIRMEARRRKAGAAEGRGMNPKPIGRIKGVSTELLDEATKIRTKGKIKKYSGLSGRPLDQVSAVEMAKRLKEGKGGKGSGVYKRTNTILDRSKTILNRHKNPLNIRQLQEKLTGKLPTKDEEMLSGVKQAFSKLEEDPDYKNKVRPLTEEESLKTFRETFAKKKTPFLNIVRDVFVADVDASLNDVAEAMVGTKEYNKVKGTAKEVQYLKDAGYQVNEFLKAVSNPESKAAKMSGFKDIPIYKLGPIIQSIADRVNEFGFERETIRDLMVNVADASKRLPLGATENAMRKLRKAGLHIDEIVGRAATFENAPGYMEAIQQIPESKNILKRRRIDNYFSKVFNESLRGEFKNVDEYNTFARQFSKKQKIDTPLIKMGKNLNPEEFVLNFKDFSPGAQENIKQIAKEKGIVIQTKGKSLFKESGDLGSLLNKLVEDAEAGGPICDPFRKAVAAGGFQGPGCGTEVRRALQENPDKFIQEVSQQKVKPGQSTGFRNIARQILNKIPKGGRLGAILAGAGAVGLGAGTLFGGSEAKADEVIQEPGTTELEAMDFQIDQPASMMYNATEGNFVNAEGEKETQPGVLNWIADNPTKSSLAAMPLMMGAGFALEAGSKFGNESVARRGLGRAGRYLKGWKALIPAMMIPHALHEYKAGYDLPEMVTNPINALWALGIRSKKNLLDVERYYGRLAAQLPGMGPKQVKDVSLGLKHLKPAEWKNLPGAFKKAVMSPAATGTNLAFGKTFRKPFVKTMQALDGIGATQGAKAWGKKALLRAALIPAGILAATPAGWLTAGFLGADFLWDQYKDYRDGNIRIDEMRARGSISEDDADNYRSLLLQGSIPFGIGNRMFGPDTMNIGGQDLDPTQQRELLKGMEAQLDEWQAGDMERRSKYREDHFEEGGRVGFKTGGMNRRDFLKWLAALAAGATGIFKGKSKDVVKPLVADATKAIPAKFIGVEGMPAWFPRAIAKIKAHGKLIEMADKHYVQGDIYEMVIPVKVPKFEMVAGKQKMSGFETVQKKVVMEDNPLTGEIELSWSVPDFDGEMTRRINFRPGQAGYQKFGVDDAEAAAQGVTEFQRVKVEEPEFSYTQPDQSQPYRDETAYLDIFKEGDEMVKGLEKMTGTKQMVTKDGTVIDVSPEGKGVDEAFQKKIYKDIEGEEAIIPTPEGAGVSSKGDVYGEEEFLEIIGGDIPEHLKKKAKGGVVETGNIAREPGLVPPLSGPTPQGEGIVGLFSNPKQVTMRS